jgi:hypothetical protein
MPAHHVLDVNFRIMDRQEGYHVEVRGQLLMSRERDELAQKLVANLVARILQIE